MDINALVPTLAELFGVSQATLLLLIGAVVAVANAASRFIPDDATGVLKVLRLVFKFIGINVSNRVTSGVTVNDVAKAVAAQPAVKRKIAEDS